MPPWPGSETVAWHYDIGRNPAVTTRTGGAGAVWQRRRAG
jgi:hypothetical protein